MRVLVTGGAGFVGRGLCRALVEAGHEVRVTSRRESADLPEGVELIATPPAERLDEWAGVVRGMDAVVHLAARAHVLREQAQNPGEEFRKVNVLPMRPLARAAAEAGVRRFVFMSSIGVLGGHTGRGRPDVFDERTDPRPHDLYAQTKWEAEGALRGVVEETGLPAVVLRPPLVYGPGVPGNFELLLKLAWRQAPFPLGAVRNQRSLIGLDNLVSLTVRCLEHPAAVGETFVCADGEDLSTAELFRRVSAALGVRPRVVKVPETLLRAALAALGKRRLAERLCDSLVVDASKARQCLGWRPPMTVDQGIWATARAFREARG